MATMFFVFPLLQLQQKQKHRFGKEQSNHRAGCRRRPQGIINSPISEPQREGGGGTHQSIHIQVAIITGSSIDMFQLKRESLGEISQREIRDEVDGWMLTMTMMMMEGDSHKNWEMGIKRISWALRN